MKILSCYIENFGKLKGKKFEFSQGLTSFCEPNGYGKTTLAAFIKAMFYGLDSVRANSKELGERRRYCPFGGGKFGGSLTFTAGGSTFRIERFFDEKSGTRDTLAVYKDGRPYSGFGDDVGGAVFGLDRQSFERTVFIGDGDVATQPTGSIAARLNAFAEGTQGDENTEAALAALERAAKKYKKSRQGGDLISAELAHIAELSHRLENAKTIAAGLPPKYEQLSALNAEAERLSAEIKRAQSANVAAADRENYERMKADIDRLAGQLHELTGAYPNGTPTRDEAARVIALASGRAACEARLGQGIDAADKRRYAELHAQFKDGVPNDDELERAAQDIKQLASAEGLAGGKNDPRAQRDAEALEGMLARYNRAERAARATGTAHRSAKIYIIAAVIAAVAIVCGVALIFAVSTAVGAAIAAAGGAGLLVTAFLYLNRKASSGGSGAARELDEITREISALLARHGYSCEGGAAYAAARFMQDVRPRDGTTDAQTAKLRERLTAFFARYGKRGEFLTCLTDLRADISEYAALDNRLRAAAEQEMSLNADIAEFNKLIDKTLEKYALSDVEAVRTAVTDGERMAQIERELERRRAAADKFKAEHSIDGAGGRIDADALNDRLTAIMDERQRLTARIAEDESYAEQADDLAAEKRDAEERLEDYRERYDILTKTAECLRQADENLKDRYIKPVRGQFGKYANALEQALGRQVTVGADFSLTFEQGGAVRSEEHLSAGELAMCSLCLRLALTDNMYKSERPFFVLDDPFAGLDEAHMGKVKKLLQGLSETVQIIYFCCHPSRKV